MLTRNAYISSTPQTLCNSPRSSILPTTNTTSTSTAIIDLTQYTPKQHARQRQQTPTTVHHQSPSASPTRPRSQPQPKNVFESPSNSYAPHQVKTWRLDSPCSSPYTTSPRRQHQHQHHTRGYSHGGKRSSILSSVVGSTIRDVRSKTSGDWLALCTSMTPSSVERQGQGERIMMPWYDRRLSREVGALAYRVVFWVAVVVFLSALFGIGATPEPDREEGVLEY